MRMLVIADSLAFHGPERAERVTDPRLWPNVAATVLAGADVDLLARLGWTARDAWWAVTKDPVAWSVLVPRADVLVLGVGGMDALPASLPTYLREGIAYLRPAPVRRAVRRTYRRLHPAVVRSLGGRMRCLPQAATDRYLTRVVQGVRHFRPGLPVVALTPAPWRSSDYPVTSGHEASVGAARRWAAAQDVRLVELDPVVGPMHERGEGNPDGLHWDWRTHQRVGEAVAAAVRAATVTA